MKKAAEPKNILAKSEEIMIGVEEGELPLLPGLVFERHGFYLPSL